MSNTTTQAPKVTKLRKTAQNNETISLKQEISSIIKPLISIEGHEHVFQKLEKEGKLPEMKAIGYMDLGQGKIHNWVSYVITIKGNKVLSIEIDEPNMRQIAEEASKINFTTTFMDVNEL